MRIFCQPSTSLQNCPHKVSTPKAGKTFTDPGVSASKQKSISLEEIGSFHEDVIKLIDSLWKEDLPELVAKAETVKDERTLYSVMNQFLPDENETATRQFLDAEIWSCFVALWESKKYGQAMSELRVFVEVDDKDGPAKSMSHLILCPHLRA
eukprot:m.383581 g.383581  ORF g.383581 m.383581 type:complete len:152 (-) comp16729_c0_seq26:995-1450(-)